MKLVDTLKRARQLIKKGWTQNAYARDRYGNMVDEDSPGAVRWCAAGALHRVTRENIVMWRKAKVLLNRESGYGGIISLNDDTGTTKEMVVSVFDRAIRSAQKAGRP